MRWSTTTTTVWMFLFLVLVVSGAEAVISGCDTCASTGQCTQAFQDAPGKFCGSIYHVVAAVTTNANCCCPLGTECIVSPYSCQCHVPEGGIPPLPPLPPPPHPYDAPPPQNGQKDDSTASTSSTGPRFGLILSICLLLCCCGCCFMGCSSDDNRESCGMGGSRFKNGHKQDEIPIATAVYSDDIGGGGGDPYGKVNVTNYGSTPTVTNYGTTTTGNNGGGGIYSAAIGGLAGSTAGTLLGNFISGNMGSGGGRESGGGMFGGGGWDMTGDSGNGGGGTGGYNIAGDDGGGYNIAGDDGGGYDIAGDDGGGFDFDGDD